MKEAPRNDYPQMTEDEHWAAGAAGALRNYYPQITQMTQMAEEEMWAAGAAAAQPRYCLQNKQAMQRVYLRNLRHLRTNLQFGFDKPYRPVGTFC